MESLQRQDLQAWEHIIVDDGSDDGTAEEVTRRAQADPRVRYLSRTGKAAGANVCRNQGLAAANTDLIVFLDSDDVLEPDCLVRRVEIMQRNSDLDFIVSRMGAFLKTPGDLGRQQNQDMIGDDLLAFLFFELPWQTTGPTWRRQALVGLGGFDETLPSWQDVDLHVRAVASGLRYVRFRQVDYHMRWQIDPGKVSTLQHRSPDHLKAAEAMLAKFERIVREGPGMTWMRQRALCSLYFLLAEHWVGMGLRSDALRCWTLMRGRQLGSWFLYGAGAAILVLQGMGGPGLRLGRRIGHKWKGWARMRTEPELVAP
jgi:glycosyltransferase involved in cell wall biosynthesis